MITVRNNYNGPFTLETLAGPVSIGPLGELTAEFDPTYLEVLRQTLTITVLEGSNLASEYRELTGTDPDKRWSDKRLQEEIDKLLAE